MRKFYLFFFIFFFPPFIVEFTSRKMTRIVACLAMLIAGVGLIMTTTESEPTILIKTTSELNTLEAVADELHMTKEEKKAFLYEPGRDYLEKLKKEAQSNTDHIPAIPDAPIPKPISTKNWDELKAQLKRLPFPREWKSPKGPVPMQAEWTMKNTTNGYYVFRNDGIFKDKHLIVLGGNLYDETVELVERGYAVWRMHKPCTDQHPMMCHEHYGYFGFLTDSQRPEFPVVNFIHGHKYAWHQFMGFKGLELGSSCSEKTGRFEPHVKHESHLMYPTLAEFSKMRGTGKARPYRRVTLHAFPEQRNTAILWNRHFASDKDINIRSVNPDAIVGHWCCGSFALPSRVVNLHTREEYIAYYAKLKSLILSQAREGRTVVDGYFIERTWHLLFGEPQEVNPRTGWFNCSNSDFKPDEFQLIK